MRSIKENELRFDIDEECCFQKVVNMKLRFAASQDALQIIQMNPGPFLSNSFNIFYQLVPSRSLIYFWDPD